MKPDNHSASIALMAANEFSLIEKYFQQQLGGVGVALGIGDDAALLQPVEGHYLAVSVDTLVSGVHFPANADPELIAERALRVNLSDMAAMGAKPHWFTLALTLPGVDEYWLEGFSCGLFQVAQAHDCQLVGGDTTRGPLSITIQIMGSVVPQETLRRAGARPGDVVYVTGTLGDGAAALAVIQGELQTGKSVFDYFMTRFYRPDPCLQQAKLIKSLASAAIDISDGLLADLGHICRASGVGATVEWQRIPVSEALDKLAGPGQRRDWVLSGGDDYQLCFTVPPGAVAGVEKLIDQGRLNASAIGTINDGREVACVNHGKPLAINRTGYQHFD